MAAETSGPIAIPAMQISGINTKVATPANIPTPIIVLELNAIAYPHKTPGSPLSDPIVDQFRHLGNRAVRPFRFTARRLTRYSSRLIRGWVSVTPNIALI